MPSSVNLTYPIYNGSVRTIDTVHAELHEGNQFNAFYNQVCTDIADKSIISFLTDTNGGDIHLWFNGDCSAPSKFYVLEGPTITDNTGATLAVFNAKRTSANTSRLWDTSQNPDVQAQITYFTLTTMGEVTGGTVIDETWVASGRKNESGGNSAFEKGLKPNTLYAFVCESTTADDNYHSIYLTWHEH